MSLVPPQEFKERLPFYNSLSIESQDVVIYRSIVYYGKEGINSVEAGGGLPDEVEKWPEDVEESAAIHKGDKVEELYDKLVAIRAMPQYNDYRFRIGSKHSIKDFDPAMDSLTNWSFDFTEGVKPQVKMEKLL